MSHRPGRLIDVWDTKLYVVEVGDAADYPILIFHGGPGFDHHEFADYLDPLAERGYRLVFVDERAQGRSAPAPPESWTLHQMAADVTALAGSLGLERYATLGHSYGGSSSCRTPWTSQAWPRRRSCRAEFPRPDTSTSSRRTSRASSRPGCARG